MRLTTLAALTLILLGLTNCMRQPAFVTTQFQDWELQVESIEIAQPIEGFVPDAETAVRIAEVVLDRIFGEEVLVPQRPYRVMLRDDRWIVKGTLPEDALGGVAHVEISRIDGRVLRVAHGE